MNEGFFKMERPENEPCKLYKAGSPEQIALMAEVERQSKEVVEIPVIINGKEIFTDDVIDIVEPHNHSHVIAHLHRGGEKELKEAIDGTQKVAKEWADMPWENRAAVFLRAGELMSVNGPYRNKMLAATMLGQSKNMWEAEIDIAELCDFMRFDSWGLQEIYKGQPGPTPGALNRLEYRPLEGFVAALTPFNFTSIGGNLPSAPAIAGGVSVWKPSTTSSLANYYFFKVLQAAGLPDGVINFVPSKGTDYSKYVITDPRMAGFHFTGSTGVFNSVWREVGSHIERYHSYPRLVGETGGKDFIFADPSANVDALLSGMMRAAFSYAGQKCSAASRAYIPASIWPELKEKMHEAMKNIYAGDIRDPKCFCNAVIDAAAFKKISGYIEEAKNSPDAEVIEGGQCDDSVGYFIQPTVILAKTPTYKTMIEEIFGPVLTVYVYDDAKEEEAIELCDTSTAYGLTGALYAEDRKAINDISHKLSQTAGNFYINEKPTGAVVGQQPFGGSRASGTNDKAGTSTNMARWVTQRAVKEVLVPETKILMPHME
jgi:1-pyrroline-5-carboxylate dehydrogenase